MKFSSICDVTNESVSLTLRLVFMIHMFISMFSWLHIQLYYVVFPFSCNEDFLLKSNLPYVALQHELSDLCCLAPSDTLSNFVLYFFKY